jgi:hypothetical protein
VARQKLLNSIPALRATFINKQARRRAEEEAIRIGSLLMSRCLAGILIACALLTGCGGGGSGSTSQPPPPPSSSATAVIQATSGVTINPANNAMQAVVGQAMQLSGSGSTDTGSTIAAYQWSVATRPSGSTAMPASPAAATTSFTPDQIGDYVLQLQVTDAEGATSAQKLAITVTDTPPTASVVTHVVFSGKSTTKPTEQVDVGSVITLDASGSSASGGATPTITWVLAGKPSGSTATLPSTGSVAHFTADVVGEYDVHVIASDSTGAFEEVDYVFQAEPPPSALVVATVTGPANGSETIQATTNYLVLLDGSGSVVAAGDGSTSVWTLLSKPSGSAAQLSALSGLLTNFTPDLVGDYVVALALTDTSTGLTSTFTTTVHVTQGPIAIVSGSASGVIAVTSGPSFASSVGVPVTLRGSGSYEIPAGPLSYSWTLTTEPSGSKAAISNSAAADATLTPDVAGTYIVQLTVTDSAGASAASTLTIQVGSYAPVAVVGQSQVSVLVGGTVTDSAALSYDPGGLPLTYSWSIDSRPAGSVATINGATNTASLSFTPDVIGTYLATVTVSNGTLNAIGQVTINAFAASSGTVPLSYEPLIEKYSRTTDKLILISANPNALHIVDPSAATDLAVPLPAAVKDLGLSPDGTRAAVLHEGVVSIVDLVNAKLLNSWSTAGSQTFVEISDAGLVYLGGQTGGQWVTPGMTVLNAATGATVQTFNNVGVFYGTMQAAYADASHQIFVVSDGLSPTQIYSVALDPGTGQVTGTTGTPYWGNYGMEGPLWLSSDETLLFTAAGTYFNATGLTYAGTLGTSYPPVISVSDDVATAEGVALVEVADPTSGSFGYPSSYLLYSSALLFPQGSIPLPVVAGMQSYGLAIFHSSTGKHVMVVQTGTGQPNAAGVQYFALLR